MKSSGQRSASFHSIVRRYLSAIAERSFEVDERTRVHRARASLRKAMLEARARLPTKRYREFSQWLSNHRIFKLAKYTPLATDFDNIDRFIGAVEAPLQHELAWLCARFCSVATEINSFLELRNEIESAVWRGRGEDAVRMCAALVESRGQSLWAIKAELAILQAFVGLEAQKKRAQGIRATLGKGSLARFVTFHAAIRNEPRTSFESYLMIAERNLNRSKTTSERKTYLKYQLLSELPVSERGIADVLRVEQSHSDIDVYECFIDCMFHLKSTSASSILESIGDDLRELRERITDVRLDAILDDFPKTIIENLQNSCAFKLLVAGRPLAATALSRKRLRTDRLDNVTRLVFSLARATSNKHKRPQAFLKSAPHTQLHAMLSIVFQKRADYDQAFDIVRKLLANFDVFPGFRAFNTLIQAEGAELANASSVHWRQVALRFRCKKDNRSFVLPEKLISFGAIEDFLRICQKKSTDVSESEILVLTGMRGSTTRIVAVRASAIVLRVLCDQQRYCEAARIVAQEVAENGATSSSLCLYALFDSVTWRDFKPERGRIEIPVALGALADTAPERYVSLARFAITEFLLAQGIEKPSQIPLAESDSDSMKIRLLSKACTEERLEHVPALCGSTAIEEERIEICHILQKLDPEQAALYEAEIVVARQRQLLAEGIRLVDSTRIHIDYEAIRQSVSRELTDDFNRYKSFVQAKLTKEESFEAILRELSRSESAIDDFAVPSSEYDALFIDIFREIADRFLHDPVHGLDAYLSRRIRHGTVVGELRSPVERRKLITDRAQSGKYQRNEYWLKRLSDCSELQRTRFSRELERFNREFDNELLRLKDKILHIRSKEHPSALIELDFPGPMIRVLRSRVTPATAFDDFFDLAVRALWILVEPSLKATQWLLEKETKQKFSHLFHGIQHSAAAQCSGSVEYVNLQRELSLCDGEVKIALGTVIGWFDRSDWSVLAREFTCEEAVSIAKQSVLSAHKAFSPIIECSHVNDRKMASNIVPMMTDILHVAIGNARSHSGLNGSCSIEICTEINDKKKFIAVVVSSKTHPSKRTHTSLELLELIRDSIKKGDFIGDVSREGKSGLKKLAGTFSTPPHGEVNFDFDEDGKFVLEVKINFFEGIDAIHGERDADTVR